MSDNSSTQKKTKLEVLIDVIENDIRRDEIVQKLKQIEEDYGNLSDDLSTEEDFGDLTIGQVSRFFSAAILRHGAHRIEKDFAHYPKDELNAAAAFEAECRVQNPKLWEQDQAMYRHWYPNTDDDQEENYNRMMMLCNRWTPPDLNAPSDDDDELTLSFTE